MKLAPIPRIPVLWVLTGFAFFIIFYINFRGISVQFLLNSRPPLARHRMTELFDLHADTTDAAFTDSTVESSTEITGNEWTKMQINTSKRKDKAPSTSVQGSSLDDTPSHSSTVERFPPLRSSARNKTMPQRVADRLKLARVQCLLSTPRRLADDPLDFLVKENVHDLVYCRNAKAATSYMLYYFQQLVGINTTVIYRKEITRNLTFNGHAEVLRRMEKYLKFTVVRHPFDRTVSCYVDKVLNGNMFDTNKMLLFHPGTKTLFDLLKSMVPFTLRNIRGGSMAIADVFGLEEVFKIYELKNTNRADLNSDSNSSTQKLIGSERPSYRQFVYYLLSAILPCKGEFICLRDKNSHTVPQAIRCNPCTFRYDAIFKTETLSEDMNVLRSKWSLPNLEDVMSQRSELIKAERAAIKLVIKNHKENAELLKNNITTINMYDFISQRSEQIEAERAAIALVRKKYIKTAKLHKKISEKTVNGSGFRKENRSRSKLHAGVHQSSRENSEKYLGELSEIEIDLLYTAYYDDFKLFGYDYP